MSQAVTEAPTGVSPQAAPEVFTLAEAAKYLRVNESDVLDLVTQHELPGRKIGGQWRLLKQAIADWLRVPAKPDFWETHFGALKDDSNLHQVLRNS